MPITMRFEAGRIGVSSRLIADLQNQIYQPLPL